MAFRIPTFNLFASAWRVNGIGGVYAAPDLTVSCNLSPSSHGYAVHQVGSNAAGNPAPVMMRLCVPKLTDIRGWWNSGTSNDIVEVPAGSKRFYTVLQVDDVAKGFLNEYRFAMLQYDQNGSVNLFGLNTAPVPLP